MKTTLELPDDVLRAVKIRAVQEKRKLNDMIADLLRRGLAQEPRTPTAVRRRVKLPLVECAHAAQPTEEMTPERVADVLLEEEAGGYRMVTTDAAFRQFQGLDLLVLGQPE